MERLTGHNVIPITKALFPIGETVTLECFIDGAAGWEFDAPLHFFAPYHRYHIVSSCCRETVEACIEDLLIDLDCDLTVGADEDAWPYDDRYLRGLVRRIRSGNVRRGLWLYRSFVTVQAWSNEFDIDCVKYECKTFEFDRDGKVWNPAE